MTKELDRSMLRDYRRHRRPWATKYILIDQLHHFCYFNGWTIPKKALRGYHKFSLLAANHRLIDGQMPWLIVQVCLEHNINPFEKRFTQPSRGFDPQLRLQFRFDESAGTDRFLFQFRIGRRRKDPLLYRIEQTTMIGALRVLFRLLAHGGSWTNEEMRQHAGEIELSVRVEPLTSHP